VEDYDMVTHEAMHVVQWGYVNPDACGYWVEGIADVARSRFGLNNAAASWALGYEPGKTYADGYTNAAHFLEWVKETYQYDVAVNLDAALRSIGCPDDLFWQKQTTLSLAELWDAYVSVFDPSQDEEPSEEPIDPAPAPVVGEPLGPDQGGQPIELDNVETL
jgi:hypothetical protein